MRRETSRGLATRRGCAGGRGFVRGEFYTKDGIATFYASRVTENPKGVFHIERTMGPDEYHNNVRQKRCRCARVTRHRTISR